MVPCKPKSLASPLPTLKNWLPPAKTLSFATCWALKATWAGVQTVDPQPHKSESSLSLLGIVLTVMHFLIKTMQPRADIVSRKPDGTLGGIKAHKLEPISDKFVPVRFDGPLTFTNVAYFEDIILEAQREFPNAKVILIIGSGINEIDASGEEKIRELNMRLHQLGVKLMFSGLKHQVRRLLEAGGVVEQLGRDAFFPDKETALLMLLHRYDANGPDG